MHKAWLPRTESKSWICHFQSGLWDFGQCFCQSDLASRLANCIVEEYTGSRIQGAQHRARGQRQWAATRHVTGWS